MFTFNTKEDFETAVYEFLKDHLSVRISLERSVDYYSRDLVPKIKVYLGTEEIASDKAWG